MRTQCLGPRALGAVGPSPLRHRSSGFRGGRRIRGLVCRADGGDDSAGGKPFKLDQAARRFSAGLKEGVDPDVLVSRELAGSGLDVQDKYRDKLRERLAERAEQLEREKLERRKSFALGQKAYERGEYSAATKLFESALNEEGPFSVLGGEIQLWLALAYQAELREEDAIELYRRVEATHPMPKIRKQAADLRFILEAPKLQVSPDERVEIPVLTNLEVNRKAKPMPSTLLRPKREKVKKSFEEEWLENYTPPRWARNYYVWVASAVLGVGLAVWSAAMRDML